MQDERNSEPGEDAEGFRRLNEDDDEVEAHRTGLIADDEASRPGRPGLTDEDDDDVEAHRMQRMGQSEDPGRPERI
jgi:hypothetical protein